MTNGVVYYLEGAAVTLTAVALASQRLHEPELSTCVIWHNVPQWFLRLLKSYGVKRVHVRDKSVFASKYGGKRGLWCRKPKAVSALTPYELTLMLDVDILWRDKLPEQTWRIIERGLATGTDVEEYVHPHKGRRIQHGMREVFGLNLDKARIRPVVGCCVGFRKNSELVQEWLQNIDRMAEAPRTYISKVPDEYAMSAIMQQGRVGHLGRCLAASCAPRSDSFKKGIIVHFGVNRWFKSKIWRQALTEAVERDDFGLRTNQHLYQKANPRIWQEI